MGTVVKSYSRLSPTRRGIESSTSGTLSLFGKNHDIPPYRQSHGIDPGNYLFDRYFEFNIETYSQYSHWRNNLSTMMGYGNIRDHWNRIDRMIILDSILDEKENYPFSELLCFPDNMGFIGTECCQKLYQDFIENEKHAIVFMSQDHITIYYYFKKSFELASDGGCVLLN